MPTTEQEFARPGLADEYFGRVSYTGSARATVATLHARVSAHTRVENSDSLLGRPVADLGSEALVDKLVRRFRGGFCYEQNGLMGYVFKELGFTVDHVGGRVVWPYGADAPLTVENHTPLIVPVPGVEVRFLVDVCYGIDGIDRYRQRTI